MIYETPSLTRMAVAKAIAHPTDDLTKVSGQVLNMTTRNGWLDPESRPTAGKKTQNFYRPSDCVIAAVVLRLWNAGFSNSDTFEAAVSRLLCWRLTDRPEYADWKDGDPVPEPGSLPDVPGRPEFPAAFILQDFCENGGLWSLQIDVRRHAVTGAFRHVGTLWRGESALGNGSPPKDGESPQSTHVIVLDEILGQVAAHTIFKGGLHGTH